MRNIDDHAKEDVEKIIVGNKTDLDSQRRVSTAKGQKMAIEYGLKLVETSAKVIINIYNLVDQLVFLQTNVNIETVFTELSSQILSKGSYMVRTDPLRVEDNLFGQHKREDKCGLGCSNK